MDDDSRVWADRGPFEMVPHWLLFDVGVSALALRMYLVLRQHADRRGAAFPSRQRLADLMGCSLPTLDRAREQLTSVGALCTAKRYDALGRQTSLWYHVHWEALRGCDELSEDAVKNLDSPRKETYTGTNTHLTHTGTSNEVPTSSLREDKPVQPPKRPKAAKGSSASGAVAKAGRRLYSDEFEAFWKVYPRKVGKRAAWKAWQQALRHDSVEAITRGAKRYADDPNREQRYTAHPTTWLNGGRWEDEPLPARGGNGTGGERRMNNYAAMYDNIKQMEAKGIEA